MPRRGGLRRWAQELAALVRVAGRRAGRKAGEVVRRIPCDDAKTRTRDRNKWRAGQAHAERRRQVAEVGGGR